MLLNCTFEFVQNWVLQILTFVELCSLIFHSLEDSWLLFDNYCLVCFLVCFNWRDVCSVSAQNFHYWCTMIAWCLTTAELWLEIKFVILLDFVILSELFHFLLFGFVAVEQPLEPFGRDWRRLWFLVFVRFVEQVSIIHDPFLLVQISLWLTHAFALKSVLCFVDFGSESAVFEFENRLHVFVNL